MPHFCKQVFSLKQSSKDKELRLPLLKRLHFGWGLLTHALYRILQEKLNGTDYGKYLEQIVAER